jgi:hypothetical protein
MQHQDFKLDGAAILDSQHDNQRVMVYNFNVPVERAQDLATFETIRQQVDADFPQTSRAMVIEPLYFQISAVYTLMNRETNEERLWQGSFNPRARDLSQVSVFRLYDSETFAAYALHQCEINRALNKLDSRTTGQESVWTLGQILSFIVSVQATIRNNHSLFNNHPELLAHGNGAARRQRRMPRQRAVFRMYFD